MDFQCESFDGSALRVAGALSLHQPPPYEIYIVFHEVFFMSVLANWKTDTSKPPLRLIEGERARTINRKLQVEVGHHIFAWSPEDYAESDLEMLVVAKGIEFQVAGRLASPEG